MAASAARRAQQRPALAPLGPMLWQQTRSEFLKLLRTPAFSVASLVLPVMFFAFFGLPHVNDTTQGAKAGAYLLASFGAYGVVSVALFSFGVGVAVERGQKMNLLMRATALSPAVYLAAKILTALAFSLLMLAILFIFGALVGGISMGLSQWLTLVVRLLLGAIPFIALGFAIGYLAGPNSAPAVTNLIYLPLSFASGLFVPLDQLPDFVRKLAPYLPTYRYGQLVWDAVGARAGALGPSVLWLLGYTAVFFAIAVRGYWREEQRSFG